MPRLFPDRLQRCAAAFICLIGLVCVACPLPAQAASASTSPVQVEGKNLRIRDDNTAQMDGVVITQTQGTLIRAEKAEGSELRKGFDNGNWVLAGKVHIEYDGFVLDAATATVVFRDRLIQSIEVRGTPALFSYPGKVAARPYKGRAEVIAYDGSRRRVRFTGHSWFSYGPSEGTSDKPLVYDLNTGELSSEDDGSDATINMSIQGKLQVQCSRLRAVRSDGTMELEQLQMTHARGGRVTAARAEGSELAGGPEDSHWKFMDQVHVEYERFVMEADAANVVFANELIKSIEVRGMPARFSHPGTTAGWSYSGTSDAITFDGLKKQVRFPDRSRFTYGPHRGDSTQPLVYELDTGLLDSEKGSDPEASFNMTFERDEQGRIAPAQKPDRSKQR